MKAIFTRSRSAVTVTGIVMMAVVLALVAGTSDAAVVVRGGVRAHPGGYAYRGAVHGGIYGQSPTYRSWSSGHYYGGYPYGGYHYYPRYGYYPHSYVSFGFGFGVPYYGYPVYGYPVYYPAPVVATTDGTAPPADGQAPDSGTPGLSVEAQPALVDSTTSFDVTNDPPPGCYYYDRFCKRKFKNLDDYTDHVQGQSHPAVIEVMQKDGTGLLELEFVGGVWKVRH